MKQNDDKTSVHISHFNFIFRLNCVCVTMKTLHESCKRFTEESSTAIEECLEFSFDFEMPESEKKGVENGVDGQAQNRRDMKNKEEPLNCSE